MDSPGTSTLIEFVQRLSVLPAGQLLPAVAEVTVLASSLSPVSGLFTVTENVIAATAPTARFPVQVRFGLEYVTEPRPAVTVASLL